MADPIIYGSSGVAIIPSWPTSGNFANQSTGVPFAPIAGDVLVTQGVGLFTARHSAVRGTIDLWVTTGTGVVGGNLLVMLASAENDLTGNSIQLTVDANNKVGFQILALGVAIATFTPGGSTIAAGTKLHIVAKWDSTTASFASDFVSVTVNGATAAGTLSLDPTVPWPTQATSVVQVGSGTGFGAFTGTIHALQVSEKI